MTLSEKKIEKIIDCWIKRLKINQIASILNLSRNTVKKYLRERLGYSYQPIGYPSYISSQEVDRKFTIPPLEVISGLAQSFGMIIMRIMINPRSLSPYSKLLNEYNQLMIRYVKLERWLMQMGEK